MFTVRNFKIYTGLSIGIFAALTIGDVIDKPRKYDNDHIPKKTIHPYTYY